MDASIRSRAEQLATEFAGQASTIEELNGLMRLMMKSALERMLNTEMDVHLGRRTLAVAEAFEPPATTPALDANRLGGRNLDANAFDLRQKISPYSTST